MSKATLNIKVGITVIVFGIALTFLIIWISKFNPAGAYYNVYGNFSNVGGLTEGSKVYLMGVEIGSVNSLSPELNKVVVVMKIKDKVKIPDNAMLSIVSRGLVGSKVVEFTPNIKKPVKDFYKKDAVIEGKPPANMDDLILEGKNIMLETKDTILSTKNLIADPELNKNIKMAVRNINNSTEEINRLLKTIDSVINNVQTLSESANIMLNNINNMTSYNKDNINEIISNSNNIIKGLEATTNTLKTIADDESNASNVKKSMENVRIATDQVRGISQKTTTLLEKVNMISSDVQDITGDPELKADLKGVVKNAKTISDTFTRTVGNGLIGNGEDKDKKKVSEQEQLKISFKNEMLGSFKYKLGGTSAEPSDSVRGKVLGNLNIMAHTGISAVPFVTLGFDEIGDGNLFNLQLGLYPLKDLRARVGLIRGKLGIGVNYLFDSTKTNIIGDTYDIASPHIRLGVSQNIFNDFGLSIYWDTQFFVNGGGTINEFNAGLLWEPKLF